MGSRSSIPRARRLKTEILIIGSGFASSILARALASQGRRVLMVERAEHPRFSLGESSTPLANLALERLARRFGWRDLWDLASWGRWRREHPELRCGLKRGFSFFAHPVAGGEGDQERRTEPLMVAASGSNEVSDTQWMRADIDAYLVAKATEAGAGLLELTEVTTLKIDPNRMLGGVLAEAVELGEQPVQGRRRGEGGARIEIEADFVVDGSGGGGVLATELGLQSRQTLPFRTSLLFAHFDELEAPVSSAGSKEPYPVQWSAVHHLLDVGWMYELRFDDGTVSCGWMLDHQRCRQKGVDLPEGKPPDAEVAGTLHRKLLRRYPALATRFETARAVRPLEFRASVQWRLEEASGPQFALLPQAFAFYDPMFSTGIAWSLLAVERLCDVLCVDPRSAESEGATGAGVRQELLVRYNHLLKLEGDHLEALLAGAYSVLDDIDRFAWYCQVYFAAASFTETQQRLLEAPDREWHWHGLLGAEDAVLVEIVRVALAAAREGVRPAAWKEMIPPLIAPRNVAGLADATCHPFYRADPGTVVAAAQRLGLDQERARELLPRLLGEIPWASVPNGS